MVSNDPAASLGGPEPHRLEDKREYWGRWQRLLFDAGYAGLSWPSEFGGGGADCDPGTGRRGCPSLSIGPFRVLTRKVTVAAALGRYPSIGQGL